MQLGAFQIDFTEYLALWVLFGKPRNPFSAKLLSFLSRENDNV